MDGVNLDYQHKHRSLLQPLSPLTYLRRNKGKVFPLFGVLILATMLIASIIAIINSVPLSIRTIYSYSRYSLGMIPRASPELIPKLRAALVEHSPFPIQRTIFTQIGSLHVRSIVGEWPFPVLGLTQNDMHYCAEKFFTQSITGRFPKSGAPEALISEPVAKNLGLKLNSIVLGPNNTNDYSPYNVHIVGIAKSPEWFVFVPLEYFQTNQFPPIQGILAFAKTPAQQSQLNLWALKAFQGQQVQLFTYQQIERSNAKMFHILYQILNIIIGVLVIVITLMMGMLMNIYQSQRVQEFGLLQAMGFTKRQLFKRMSLEAMIMIVTGWIVGIGLAVALLKIVDHLLMQPHAFVLNPLDPMAYVYTIPVPLVIFLAALVTIAIRFRKFDPIEIIERRLI